MSRTQKKTPCVRGSALIESAVYAFVFAAEGAAVHTTLVGRLLNVGRDLDRVEGTVVLIALVVAAVAHRTAYRVVSYLFIKHIYHLAHVIVGVPTI